MSIRSLWSSLLVGLACALWAHPALTQTTTPVIAALTVDQVPQLTPGTELVFRANGTANGTLRLRVDGVASLIELPQARPGAYEGAYTISIRDKIGFDAKVTATLTVGERQATAVLAQHLLHDEAHARALAAASPAPQINRIETRNSGALSGGHEVDFIVNGTPGASASVSLDGGKTSIALTEQKSGQYSGSYTIKTRDRFSDTTPVQATLTAGGRKTTAVKPLVAGAMSVAASLAPPLAVAAKCDNCGVVQSVTRVKLKGKPNYVGAIAGGIAGGVLGNQVGKGDGNTAATVIGAVGGAVAGREIEKRVRSNTVYDVVVKMGDGTARTVRFEAEPAFRVGSKVKVSGETLVADE